MYAFVGPFIMIVNLGFDLVAFWRHLYQHKISRRLEKASIRAIGAKTYQELSDVAKYFLKKQHSVEVPLVSLVKAMRDKMGKRRFYLVD